MSIYYESPDGLCPSTHESAGLDLRSNQNIIISPGDRRLISTGIRFQLVPGTWALIKSRSSLAVKGIDVGAGVIDSDYRGEIKVLICNQSQENFSINIGDRIAQMIIMSHTDYSNLVQVDSIENNTDRGEGGFGSTGKS